MAQSLESVIFERFEVILLFTFSLDDEEIVVC